MLNYKKLDQRIDDMLKYESDDFLVNINLSTELSDKLLPYQFLHVFNLITALRSNNIVVDGSDTGTGKTYTAIAICKHLGLKPLIICPKTIITKWHQVCSYFGVTSLAIVNYETIKNGKYYSTKKQDNNLNNLNNLNTQEMQEIQDKPQECPYITIVENSPDYYKWNLPKNTIIIFDEVHVCKNANSQNGVLLKSTKNICNIKNNNKNNNNINNNKNNNKILLISATLSDTTKSFNIFGYMIGLYKNIRNANSWIKSMLKEDACYMGKEPKFNAMYRAIYPFKGSRISISDLGSQFPENQIYAECYDLDKKDTLEVNKYFTNIKEGDIQLKSNIILSDNKRQTILTEITYARKKIEKLKIPLLEEQIKEYLENNYSVVVFVNYLETLQILADKFKTTCLIYGELDSKSRMENIENFQKNDSKLIICTSQTGGLGISLHDIHGGHPRVSLISPTFSAIQLTQCLGRIHRAGSKSRAFQRIIYCANTCEEVICNLINEKLKFSAKLTDEDLVFIK